ncbi:hypothetical protein TNIN_413351 [Trichonephila inaurata madagascariensis]|uniref:Uncharacterized protein n=1 Tax=Trichonephila inaurata madagascariensis TaxID=2747483 RepID=A0A8X6XYL7_9ARAC|nr:hypothetical protein TNIN_413351 [Trichonephila inaurata madagascariensis]
MTIGSLQIQKIVFHSFPTLSHPASKATAKLIKIRFIWSSIQKDFTVFTITVLVSPVSKSKCRASVVDNFLSFPPNSHTHTQSCLSAHICFTRFSPSSLVLREYLPWLSSCFQRDGGKCPSSAQKLHYMSYY